ncbi:hypothetical protein CPB86DRAFT_466516 [Serendipita vermifera]|nr:hypothetical protein CPB86DRAFT_466516 [Serendipita vermifera]
MDLFQAIIYRFIGSNKTTLYKDLFLPEHPVQAGGKWAIPKRFDIKLQESSDTDEDLDRIDKEFVYDLEPTRYPFKIQLDEDLPNRMLEELRPMLGERPISPEIQDTWANFQAFIQDSITSREDAATTLYTFWIVTMAYFRPLDTENRMKSSFCPSTKDRRGGVDTHISMGSETVIVASALEPNPSNKYAERLVDMASSPEPSIFEGDLPEVLLGHEAALAKLSYTIMDGCGQGPRWAMLYQGNDYIIYLVLPVLAENTRRCTLISSGVLSIDDSRCPFLAVMLFMLLSAHKSHQELCTMLNIKPPRYICRTKPSRCPETGNCPNSIFDYTS